MLFEKRGRDKLYIIAEILEITKDGSLKTQVMYRANLSFTQMKEYLDFLLRIDLVKKVEVRGKDVYQATEKGLDFLQRYHEIRELLRFGEPVSEETNMSVQVRRTTVA